jgi:uncharacterized protein (DUF1697 family)
MTTHIALLRAVNVSGRKPIPMAELRDLLTEIGFIAVRSLLQTGNLVFRSDVRKRIDLERLLQEEAAERLDLHTDFFVRTAAEWKAIVSNNPFREEATRDPAHLVVMFLKHAPSAKDVEALQTAITGPETVSVGGGQAYIVYPAGIGRSRLTNIFLEKRFRTRSTARNWNTILKLAALAED